MQVSVFNFCSAIRNKFNNWLPNMEIRYQFEMSFLTDCLVMKDNMRIIVIAQTA